MKNILLITTSIQSDRSVSNRLAETFLDSVVRDHPAASIVRRDLGAEPLPHLTAKTVAAIRGEPSTPAEREARALSDRLIDEVRSADLVVIASPMYNFGMSSALKSWFDHVLRAGVTFRYSEQGPEGLLGGRKLVVIETRDGLYSEGPAAVMDGQEPHLATLFRFMGLDDITFVRAEGLAGGPDAAAEILDQATRRLKALAAELRAPTHLAA